MKLEMNQQAAISHMLNSNKHEENSVTKTVLDTVKNEEENSRIISDVNKEKAEEIVTSINDFLKPHYTSINFKLHDETEKYYVQVIDKDTEKVIREIPSKELLDMFAKMSDFLGLFVDKKL